MDCNKSILVKQSSLYKELVFVNWGQSCQHELKYNFTSVKLFICHNGWVTRLFYYWLAASASSVHRT
jgi:hypothetical protein